MPSKLVLSIVFLFFQSISFAQSDIPLISSGHYVIIGAFEVQQNAIVYKQVIQKSGLDVNVGYVPSRNLYYVYLNMDLSIEACLEQVKITRQDPRFTDAWVRRIDDEVSKHAEVKTDKEIERSTNAVETEIIEEAVEDNIHFFANPSLEQTEVFLSLYNEANDRVVAGKVRVIDSERARLLTEVDGNTYLMLPDPKSKTRKITLLCEAFGYRKVQHEIDFNKPYTDSTAAFIDDMGTSLIVKFPLVRYMKGEIHTLYNVYFYNDAAVFLPESRFELNELLVMMKENPAVRIRLHGHTNGSYHGKIIRVGASQNFFSITQDVKTGKGSSKELSESRAEVIRDYLAANGVEPSRVEIKAWGGKKPLFDKHDANAKRNIRVEVEVLDL